MSRSDIDGLLAGLFRKRAEPLAPPTEADWEVLCVKFGCDFSQDFMALTELATAYWFEGELYGVAAQPRFPGEASIAQVYDSEMDMMTLSGTAWQADMIPFYGVGNGDCSCLSASRGPASPVYYVYHEDGYVEEESPSFEQWLTSLPDLSAEEAASAVAPAPDEDYAI